MKQIPKRTTIRLKRQILFIFSMLVCSFSLQAQVNIGSGTAAQKFSALEITSNGTNGLRLPQMTSSQRDALTNSPEFIKEKNRQGDGKNPGLGLGLTIYNTDTNCTEYWNGYKWVSLCLGTADIKLSSSCGEYDPTTPPVTPAEGSNTFCEYVPSEAPACTVTTGRAFEVSLTIGNSYATIKTDNSTSGFIVEFQANNTSMIRNAVVRVTSNCTGEFKDFIFQQEAATCVSAPDPTLNVTNLSLCNSGSVFAHVTNAQKDVDYVWTFAGSIVHTGTSFEIKRAGEYKVYSGLLGCGKPAILTVKANNNSTAPSAIEISATNQGLLCKGGNVILSANTSSPVLWYHNGIPGSTNNPLSVSGADSAGQWFAVVTDASGCVSNSSEIIELKDNTNSGTALPVPVATINGQAMNGTVTICKGGSLKLEITNSASYPEGTSYEWFSNGISIGKSSNTKLFYNIPGNATEMTISVTATDQSGNCPNSQMSQKVKINLTAPSITSINNGATIAAICGGNDAILIAKYTTGQTYEWMKDGQIISGETSNTLKTSTTGNYTVRYKDANGCWSKLSSSIEVIRSSSIKMSWVEEPANAIKGSEQTYTVKTIPGAKEYKWDITSENSDAIKSVTPLGDGSSVLVVYNSPSSASSMILIKVTTVGEPCGDTSLAKAIFLVNGCTEGTSVNLTPKDDSNVTVGSKQNFSATTNASNDDLKFEWFVNDKSQGAASATNTFSFTPTAKGTYEISVRVTNSCTDASKNVKASVKITADPNPTDFPSDNTNNYILSGKTSFDIYQNFNNLCGLEPQRAPDFLDASGQWIEGKEFEYTFNNKSNSYSDLYFVTDDPNVLIKSRKSDIAGKKYIITFDKSVLSKAANLDNANALYVTIYALYTNSNGKKSRLELKLKIKDCWEGCGAYVGSNTYKEFMCYNLGVADNETADPLESSKAIQGARYKWGAKNPATTQSQDENSSMSTISNWLDTSLYPYEKGSTWDTNNNPCPAGYRLPTATEWDNILKYNKQTNTTLGWQIGGTTPKYKGGLQLGDNLFLPAAGARSGDNGLLNAQSIGGYYWSSSARNALIIQNTTVFINMYLSSQVADKGYSVRCIAE